MVSQKLGPQIGQQRQDLLLDGDIERGGRFIRDKKLGTVHNRHGDHDALPHAAGELVREIARPPRSIGDRHIIHRGHRPLLRLRPGNFGMSQNGFGDLIADTHHRIESRHRLLKNHRDARATQAPHRFFGKTKQVERFPAIAMENLAAHDGLGRKQPDQGERGERLSRAGFADQPKNLARRERKIEVVNGRERAPASGRKPNGKTANLNQRKHAVW